MIGVTVETSDTGKDREDIDLNIISPLLIHLLAEHHLKLYAQY